MDERTYCLTPEQWRHAKACLTLAKRWGLIGDDSPEALERRRAAKTHRRKERSRTASPCTARGASLPPPTCNMS